ncbi:MAG TPA: VOC family protein [Candidatus Krumholzibacteria bacterium]|nr:VOC family protein [Candidatus Krumholzibacteria bacterium]
MPVKPIPDNYHSVTPYLIVKGAASALDFYKRAFGAEETVRMESKGTVVHSEFRIGDSVVMLADEMPAMGHKSPQSLGGTPAMLMIYVENVDQMFTRAISAGATEVRPVTNEFYGDRAGSLKDPFGHQWMIATHVEDVAPDEMDRRFREMLKGMGL